MQSQILIIIILIIITIIIINRLPGSMPVVGSSRMTTRGRPIKAIAALTFLLLPPLSNYLSFIYYFNILDNIN
jgi:hypothetical protein